MNSKKKQNNKGFSLIELLVSLGIMSVVVTVVAVLMSTSSDTYRSVSTDSQLQSEAQVVANSITNLAVDSINASCDSTIVAPPSGVGSFDLSDEKYLVLTNETDNRRYVIARDTAENKIYYFEQTYDESTGAYGALSSKSLLGDYIYDFDVDVSRVEKKNIITFSLLYKKNGKSYKGDYQVFMRNRKYTASKTLSGNTPTVELKDLTLTPKKVWVEVKDGKPTAVEKQDAVGTIRSGVAGGQGSVEFTATTIYNGVANDEMKSCDWNLIDADDNYFRLSSEKGEKNHLLFEAFNGVNFKSLNKYNFSLTASKASRSKKADVYIRIVKDLTIAIASGSTTWKDSYLSTPYNGVKASNVPDANYGMPGKTMTLNAKLTQFNTNEGVDWKLEYCDATVDADEKSSNWTPCNDASIAKLANSYSIGSTNTLTFATNNNLNTKKFRVTVTSRFDPSFKACILIGVIPTSSIGGSDGFHSRGYYVDLNEYFKVNDIQGYKVSQLVDVQIGSNGDNNDLKGAFKVTPAPDFKLFMDYGTFQYDKGQEDQYYMRRELCLNITFKYNSIEGDKTVEKQFTVNDVKYELKAIEVNPVGPSVICMKKGDSADLFGKTAYANILRRDLIGIYTKQSGATEFSNNINIAGMEGTDKYLQITLDETALGTVNKFVDTARMDVTAKTNLKTYPVDGITIRYALKDYYNIKKSTASYTDFTVYIANVAETNVYIPGPNAKTVAKDSGSIGWPSTLNTTGTTEVTGMNTGNSTVTAQVYKDGNNYFCTYNGNTYKYNKTYEYWQKN